MSEIKHLLRAKYGLPTDAYLIGSFQRDTEGCDLISPKLEKGPDLFADYAEALKREHDLMSKRCGYSALRFPHVVLAGWRRQYLINRLKTSQVSFSYYELPSQDVLNELYQTLDLYVVTARHEGGPQALIECGLLGVPVISTPVGIAEQVLPPTAIAEAHNLMTATPAVPDVENWKLPNGYEPYRRLIKDI